MNNADAILRYKTSMAVFKQWRDTGIISDDDLRAIDTVIAQKYGLSMRSIFLEHNLLCGENRANMSVEEPL